MAISGKLAAFNPAITANLPVLSQLALNLAFTIAKWQLRSSTRRGLARLDDHMLRDIGLDPAVAHAESGLWFWQA